MAADISQDTFLDDGKYIIIKGRFKSQELTLFGLFIIIFNPNEQIEIYNIVVSPSSGVFNLEPHIGWEKYEETILDLKWKGNFNNSMTIPLMEQLKNITADDKTKNQLFESIHNYDYDNVEILLGDIIYRIIHDKNLNLEIGIQEITREEFINVKENKAKANETSISKKGYNVEDGSVILPLQPILAPVKGKPLYEMKIGDRIIAKIVPKSERENYFIDLLDLRLEDHIKPIACEVIDIKANSKTDPIEILVQIGPGIYGRIIEEERQVKLRIYDPKIDGPMTKKTISGAATYQKKAEEIKVENKPAIPKMTYIIAGLFLLILIIFVILLYLSF